MNDGPCILDIILFFFSISENNCAPQNENITNNAQVVIKIKERREIGREMKK